MLNLTLREDAPDLSSSNAAAYAVVFGCVVLLGFPLNAASLWILVRRHRLKSPSAVVMINLAASDLLLVLSLPLRVYFHATGAWALGVHACVWITMLFRKTTSAPALSSSPSSAWTDCWPWSSH
ncbi:hypothetical protein NHX12_008381 [Muraenolepis orangiensis]|uniref:G-protein coupled receptors family 1 profile domain-containing protein n=1 Tax=Muraenolepis orangiensis TaxID=630683 RepID=A0A9Q0DKN2_9TELE|nr:hypothetical protein NHX12_008381 [Muraenolepis orangiensis]